MKKLTSLLPVITLAAITSACTTHGGDESDPYPERAAFVGSLFTGSEQYESFNRMEEIFPAHAIPAAPAPYRFPVGEPIELPAEYRFEGSELTTDKLLDSTRTTALLVLQDGRIRYEQYWLTGGPDEQWLSMSVGKSFVSALVGIAVGEGLIRDITDPITDYVPALSGSAYDNVRIKDVLQMSSGARWNEDYSDPDSDIMRYGQTWASGASFDAFTASLVREHEPGTVSYYNSTDTQALGMLLVNATGQTMAAYARENLFNPLGMEQDAYWLTDDHGREMAAGGLNLVARDYAKLGQLYLQQGRWQGEQIVPADWVSASVVPDAPHLLAAAHPEYPVSYGYQWWIPDGSEGEFCAIGVYNQFIYVNPQTRVVIVKLSAFPEYGMTNESSSWRELETFEFFRAVSRQLASG